MTNSLNEEIQELRTVLSKFAKSSDRYSSKLVILTWALVFFTLILVAQAYLSERNAKDYVSAQNNIALNSLFFTTANSKIIASLENNLPILSEHGGKSSDTDLDNYLGTFDTIESAFTRQLLNEADFCDSFSHYIDMTSRNKEVQSYVVAQQKINAGYFTSLSDLETVVTDSKNQNCH
ncbi:MAG TPA: hypothetical protein VMU12_00375 [Candidatus Paceibacterota bacterium]|nr:hypothetical protein [Candidatus Paceibacterota bacterium]